MFGKLNKVLLGAVLIGGIMGGNCMSSEYNGFSSFDDVYSAYRNLKSTTDLHSSQQMIYNKILDTQQITPENLAMQAQIAFLWKAREILGNFFQSAIDTAISSKIGFNINDTTDYDHYVRNRFVLAYTLFQSQSHMAPNITPNTISSLNIDNLSLSNGYTSCILGYAIDILDDIKDDPTAQKLMEKIQKLKS